MPIDPEVAAEIKELKNKLLKLETDLTGLSGKDLAEAKKEITSLRTDLSELLKLKKDPPAPPIDEKKDEESDEDPVGAFIDRGEV